MSTITYQLVDGFVGRKTFDDVQSAIDWLRSLSKDKFRDVTLTDGKLNVVDGYDAIIKAYERNNDLWQGDADCIHLNTHGGIGGGCHCDTCTGWFCY